MGTVAEPTDELLLHDPNAGTAAEKNKRVTLSDLLAYLVNRVLDKCLRFTAPGSAPAVSGANEGALYTDGTSLQVSLNGGAFWPIPLPAVAVNWFNKHVIQAANASAFAVGANGDTNPALRVVTNVANQATGVTVTGNASGGGALISVISPGANESLTIQAKNSANINFNVSNFHFLFLNFLISYC